MPDTPAPRLKSRLLTLLRPSDWFIPDVVLPWLASRIMLIVVAWIFLHLTTYAVNGKWEIGAQGKTVNVDGRPLSTSRVVTNVFSRWDAGWYLQLARDGYQFVPGQQSNAAFFPVYPFLVRCAHFFAPGKSDGSWLNTGIVVSNLILLLGLTYLYRLVRLDFDTSTAQRSILYLLLFPTTLFFSAVYTESSFLCVTVASVYYARKGKWWLSGLFGAVAVVTRSPGIVMAAPLGLEYLRQRQFKLTRISWDIFAIALPPIALGGFLWFMQWRFGNAFATRDAQFAWAGPGGGLSWPWTTAAEFFKGPITMHGGRHSMIDFAFTVFCFGLCVVSTIRLPMIYAAFGWACLFFTIGWGSFAGMSRYSLAIFPIFVVLALAGRKPTVDRFYLTISTGLAALFMMLFAHWDWVG